MGGAGLHEVAHAATVTVSDDDPRSWSTSRRSHHERKATRSWPLGFRAGQRAHGVRFHPGVEYRHLCIVPREATQCTPPHDHRLAAEAEGPATKLWR
jgi:hypothetical protein